MTVTRSIVRDKVSNETRIVARLLANRELLDQYFQDDHLQCASWWQSQKLYHLFMLLLWLRSDGENNGFWHRLEKMGKEILKEEQKSANC